MIGDLFWSRCLRLPLPTPKSSQFLSSAKIRLYSCLTLSHLFSKLSPSLLEVAKSPRTARKYHNFPFPLTMGTPTPPSVPLYPTGFPVPLDQGTPLPFSAFVMLHRSSGKQCAKFLEKCPSTCPEGFGREHCKEGAGRDTGGSRGGWEGLHPPSTV